MHYYKSNRGTQKTVTRICNFPTTRGKRCKQPVTGDRPNCGRHECEIPSEQLGQGSTVYRKDGELHVWTGKPDNVYCLIHNDPAYQVLCQLAGEVSPCCLRKDVAWKDEHGKLHREDGPALIWPDGTQKWYWHGEPHREGGPALIWLNGAQIWCLHDKYHRENGPAVIMPDGRREWYLNGNWHREDGPAKIWPDGAQEWYQYGELHRDDGPAVTWPDGTQEWYQNGERHRDDGPARVWPDGAPEWWWHNKRFTEQRYNELRAASVASV